MTAQGRARSRVPRVRLHRSSTSASSCARPAPCSRTAAFIDRAVNPARAGDDRGRSARADDSARAPPRDLGRVARADVRRIRGDRDVRRLRVPAVVARHRRDPPPPGRPTDPPLSRRIARAAGVDAAPQREPGRDRVRDARRGDDGVGVRMAVDGTRGDRAWRRLRARCAARRGCGSRRCPVRRRRSGGGRRELGVHRIRHEPRQRARDQRFSARGASRCSSRPRSCSSCRSS